MKMEGIELYPHNQKAYDNLCAMLRDSNRACVVQPTGTGKFVIIAKMAQDNPGKNFLLLGTNDYMYIDQMANLSDIAPGFTPKNLQFMTYATAMATRIAIDRIDWQSGRRSSATADALTVDMAENVHKFLFRSSGWIR